MVKMEKKKIKIKLKKIQKKLEEAGFKTGLFHLEPRDDFYCLVFSNFKPLSTRSTKRIKDFLGEDLPEGFNVYIKRQSAFTNHKKLKFSVGYITNMTFANRLVRESLVVFLIQNFPLEK